jgi:hypothetical protein
MPICCADGSCAATGDACAACRPGLFRSSGRCVVDGASRWDVAAADGFLTSAAVCPGLPPNQACPLPATIACLGVAGVERCTRASAASKSPAWNQQLFAAASAAALIDRSVMPAMRYLTDGGQSLCEGPFDFLDDDFQRGAARVVCDLDPNSEITFALTPAPCAQGAA